MSFLWSNFFEKVILSSALTLAVLFYNIFDYDYVDKFKGMMSLGFTISKDSFFSRGIPQEFEMLPVVLFWILVGVLAYFLYFSLLIVYYNLEQLIVSELFFTKAKIKKDDNRSKRFLKKLYVHTFVVTAYFLSFLFLALVIFPVFNLGWSYLGDILKEYLTDDFALAGVILASFLAWYLVVSSFISIFRQFRDILWEEKLEEEHGDI